MKKRLDFSTGYQNFIKLCGKDVINFLRNCQFSKVAYHFTFPPAMYESFGFSTSSSTLTIVCLFYYSHSNGHIVVSHCGFDLHFPKTQWFWTAFYVLISHLGVFGEVSIQVFCTFLNWVIVLFWVIRVLCIF